ncbi:DUF4297 domain-containing protein [Pseudoduganella sp. FT55W]|uniref:DUF4297 domain-containing protein n=1 Tax=Duganella rivi TaxID=2666083 RepID=A0A7X4KA72_9BURK|nr:dsDNA nuclease domain-containing protein [Duganella rivi]MYM65617.1 DUF4297 domain-containing protein [Duganella rivi]
MTLADVAPREQDGRDSFARYRAQVRAAAVAALAILESKDVDRVYCDLHDDYVVRSSEKGAVRYRFVQVKTKGKQHENWTIGELLGIDGRLKDVSKCSAAKIRESFVGKLLLHTVIFGDTCESVTFQTNNHLDGKAEDFRVDVEDLTFSDKHSQLLINKFNECFQEKISKSLTPDEIKNLLSRLCFDTDVSHIKLKNVEFDSTVRKKIHEYSEVELSYSELNQILLKLLDLIASKSSGVIDKWDAANIDDSSSVDIEDLLDIMAISRPAYLLLRAGNDEKAVKSASLIQRILGEAAKDSDTVEYCSRCKIKWDEWCRKTLKSALDLAEVIDEINQLLDTSLDWKRQVKLSKIKAPLQILLKKLHDGGTFADLDLDALLGAFFSEYIKRTT